jgi:hypothetical protein
VKYNKKKLLGVFTHPLGHRAAITANGKRHDLGVFSNPDDAALAYDRALVKYKTNFKGEDDRRELNPVATPGRRGPRKKAE